MNVRSRAGSDAAPTLLPLAARRRLLLLRRVTGWAALPRMKCTARLSYASTQRGVALPARLPCGWSSAAAASEAAASLLGLLGVSRLHRTLRDTGAGAVAAGRGLRRGGGMCVCEHVGKRQCGRQVAQAAGSGGHKAARSTHNVLAPDTHLRLLNSLRRGRQLLELITSPCDRLRMEQSVSLVPGGQDSLGSSVLLPLPPLTSTRAESQAATAMELLIKRGSPAAAVKAEARRLL